MDYKNPQQQHLLLVHKHKHIHINLYFIDMKKRKTLQKKTSGDDRIFEL